MRKTNPPCRSTTDQRRRAELVDLMGNGAPLALANARAHVSRSPTPVFIVHGTTTPPRVLEP